MATFFVLCTRHGKELLKVDPSITLHTKSGQIEAVKRENDEHAINSKTCYKTFLPRKVGTYLILG